MKHLYFQHSNKTYTLVEKNVGEESDQILWLLIFRDIRNKNPEFKPRKQESWVGTNGRRWFDVGAKEEMYVVF